MERGEERTNKEERTECAICISQIKERCQIKSCGHEFCYECIRRWSESRRLCPLCNIDYTILIRSSLVEETVPVPIVCATTVEDDLQALDHSFFASECENLLSDAEQLRKTLWNQKKNNSSRFGVDKNWNKIQTTIGELTSYLELFHSDERFEPYPVLQDLYRIQEQIQQIRNPNLSATTSQPSHYSSEDDKWEEWEGMEMEISTSSKKRNGRMGKFKIKS